MKKKPKFLFNLLIVSILCSPIGISATSFLPTCPNNFSVSNSAEIDDFTTPIDIKSKKKKSKKTKASGKVTFDSFDEYYKKALKFYDSKAWLSAARIFEELYPLSIGTPRGDSILFLFADSYFQNRDYQMASFHFKTYTRSYPGTARTELAALNSVKSLFYSSPDYQLDQFTTTYAIEEIGLYIQQYPYSPYIQECNEMLDKLRDKLAEKEMETVRMYYHSGYYKATQIASRNFLKDYSYSKFAPEVLFILVKNNFEYAKKSVDAKKQERYLACLDAIETLTAQYPDNKFILDTKKFADEAQIQINKINERNKKS